MSRVSRIVQLAAAGALLLLKVEQSQALVVNTSVLYDKLVMAVQPSLYGSTVLYQGYSGGTYRLFKLGIDGSLPAEVRNNGTTYLWPLAFGGSHAAWIGYGSGGTSGGGGIGGIPIPGGTSTTGAKYYVKAFDIGTKAETSMSPDSSYKEALAVDGKRVVWTDYRYFSSDSAVELYFAEVGGSEKRITSQRGYKASPAILGDRIVWQDYRNAGSNPKNADIYLYDLAGQKEYSICTNPAFQDQPSVHGDYIVWQDYRNTGSNPKNADIYGYDLQQNKEFAICTAPGYQGAPKVYGNLVVWQDFRNATTDTLNADIYLFNLATGQEHQVTTMPGYQSEPELYGTNIVWMDFYDLGIVLGRVDENASVRKESLRIGAATSGKARHTPIDLQGRNVGPAREQSKRATTPSLLLKR